MCESIALLGDPIALDLEPTPSSRPSSAPVLWRQSTQELIIARPDIGFQTECNVVFQHRDIDGALLDEPIGPLVHDNFSCSGNAALSWNESLGRFLFAGAGQWGNSYRLLLESFDQQGASQWFGIGPYVCNNEMQTAKVRAVDDRFYVMGSEFHCAGGGEPRNSFVEAWDPDGLEVGHVDTGEGYYGDAACLGPDCVEALALRRGLNPVGDLQNGISATWGQIFDVDAFEADPNNFNLGPVNLQHGGVAGNGSVYLVATAHYGSPVSMPYTFRLVEPDGSAMPAGTTMSLPRRPSYFDIIWTGDGWVVATSVWEYNGMGIATSWTDYEIRLWHLAPDASLRETFILEEMPGLMPKLALMPGKVAITWVRPGAEATRQLGFLGCN